MFEFAAEREAVEDVHCAREGSLSTPIGCCSALLLLKSFGKKVPPNVRGKILVQLRT